MAAPRMTPTQRLDAIVLANFMALGIIIAAVPRYLHGPLHASRTATGAATTIYFVAALIMRPFVGSAVDRIGRRPFIVLPPIGLVVLTLGYEVAHSVLAVAALRFLAGGFAALFFTSVALAATDLVAPHERTRALSRQSVMTYTGFTLGPIVADRLIHVSWTLVWLVAAGLHAMTTVLAAPMAETRRADAPTATARFGFDRRVVRPAIGLLVANFSFSTIVAFLPEYSERLHISSPGLLFATYAICVLTVRSLTGRLADRIGPARFTIPTMTIGGLGLTALALSHSSWQSFIAIGVVGGSLGATYPSATAAALARVGPDERGRAMGTAFALGDVGQASAGPLVGFLSTQLGFRWVYGLPAVLAVFGVMTVASMPEVRRRRTSVSIGDRSHL